MFRVTRYPMISKTESGRVGYRKKHRVAGWVRVPAGHCLPPIADHLIKYLIPITKFIQNTNTAPYSKYRPWMPNSHIPKKQMHAFKYTPPKIQTTGPQIPNYMIPIKAYTTKNTKWRVRKCPKIPNIWSRNQHQQIPNSCPQITNTVWKWHFKVLYNVHPCSREILALGVSSLCVEQSAYNRSVRHLVPLDNGAVRLAFGHNLVTAFRRLCHRSVGPALGPRHHPLSHNGQTHAFNSTKSPNWPQSHKVFKMGNSNELKSPAVPPKSAILLPKKK